MMPRQGWTRAGSDDPAAVMDALNARELESLEVCRHVWEHENDPVALCEAVRLVDVPEWLRSALLVLITDGEEGYPSWRRRWWRTRRQHATDRARAAHIAMARAHAVRLPWEQARQVGDRLARERYPEIPEVSDAGLKRAYDRVRRSLAGARGRYYCARAGLGERIQAAWEELARIIEASLTPK